MNPILKRTITGLVVGAAVAAAILFAPPSAVMPVVLCLIALAVVEFALLMRMKVRRWTELPCAAFLVGAAVIFAARWRAFARVSRA